MGKLDGRGWILGACLALAVLGMLGLLWLSTRESPRADLAGPPTTLGPVVAARDLPVQPPAVGGRAALDAGVDYDAQQPATEQASIAQRVVAFLEVRALDYATRLPVPQAEVHVVVNRPGHPVDVPGGPGSTTDAEGRVHLAVEPGSLQVRVHASDGRYGSASTAVEPGATASLDVSLAPLVSLRGVVRDAGSGAPVAGARVGNHITSGLGQGEARTDGSGRFEFTSWAPGVTANLSVEAAGYGSESITLVVVPGQGWARVVELSELTLDPSDPFIEVELSPHKRIHGRLLGPDGGGAPGARVEARGRHLPSKYIGVADDAVAVSGPDGSFELEGLRWDIPHAVVAEHPDGRIAVRLAPAERVRVDLGSINLEPRSRLSGVVQGAHGTPLSGARVRVRIDLRALFGEAQAEALAGALDFVLRAEGPVDPEGRFELDCAPALEARLFVDLGGRVLAERTLDLPAGAWNDLGLIALETDVRLVEAVVQDPSGNRMAGLELLLWGDANQPWGRVRTADDGRFQVAIEPDRVRSLSIAALDAEGRQTARWSHPVLSFPRILRLGE